jgi:hypothetical protein
LGSVLYYVLAVSFAGTGISGLAMLVAPEPWLALQKRLLSLVPPNPQSDAFLKLFERVPVRAVGAAYLVFGAVAFYLLTTGKLWSLFAIPIPVR